MVKGQVSLLECASKIWRLGLLGYRDVNTTMICVIFSNAAKLCFAAQLSVYGIAYRSFACRQIAARVGRKFTGILAGVGFSSRSEDETSVGF